MTSHTHTQSFSEQARLSRIAELEDAAVQLSSALVASADVDHHAVERAMIGLRRSVATLRQAVTGDEKSPKTRGYLVCVPGQETLYPIVADHYEGLGVSGARFYLGDEVVASFPETRLIADSSCAPELNAAKAPVISDKTAPEPSNGSAFVELIAGETLVVSDELSEAIKDCSRLLAGSTETTVQLMGHLTALLAEQRAKLTTTKVAAPDRIGLV